MRLKVAPERGIVHFGPGAFFRAFNATFTEDAVAARGGDWGITAVSLRSPDARDAMTPQDGAFTAVTLAPEGREARVIGAVREVLVASEKPEAVLDALSDPAVRIVSLTITEKGYVHAPATGRLRLDDPDIAHDLAHPDAPRTAPGFLVAGLARRRSAGLAPFTILSCDNLPNNGALTRRVVLDFAEAQDPDLAAWIAREVAFPASMVDRITPATTAQDIADLKAAEGYDDPAMVVHEPFRQWVIEDHFPNGRPAWEAAGAQLVSDVRAHEEMKLRCLNGTHSTLAYLGYLAGYESIAETVADPAFATLCERMWHDEIMPTLQPPEGEDLARYCAALLTRYRNPNIHHRTWQIAMDGSQKLPQRLLGTLRDSRAQGAMPKGVCLAVAGWMRYVSGRNEAGQEIDVRDPMAAELRALSDAAVAPANKVDALLGIREIFGDDLSRDDAVRAVLTDALDSLMTRGARATVQDWSA